MKIKLESEELWPYFEEWCGYGNPEYDVEIPDELWESYSKALDTFMKELNKMKTFLNE